MIKKLDDLNYTIQSTPTGQQKVIHHNKLKPYEGDKVLKWASKAVKKAKSFPKTPNNA